MAMFENISEFFKRFMQNDRKELLAENTTSQSKETAKDRLHVVLMQDRANVSADFLELMKEEIIEVIKKYIVVDESKIDVRLTNEENEDGSIGVPLLHANIPILNIRNDLKGEYMHSNSQDKIEGQEELELDNNNNVQIIEPKTIQKDVESEEVIVNLEPEEVIQENKIPEIEVVETKNLENEVISNEIMENEINNSKIINDVEVIEKVSQETNNENDSLELKKDLEEKIVADEIEVEPVIEQSKSQEVEIDFEDEIDELDDDDDDDVTFDDLLKAAEEEEEKLKKLEENKDIKENEEEKKVDTKINKTTSRKKKTSKSSKKK